MALVNTVMNLRVPENIGKFFIHLAQDRDQWQWQGLVNTLLNIPVL
jgi:hypothetical protein